MGGEIRCNFISIYILLINVINKLKESFKFSN